MELTIYVAVELSDWIRVGGCGWPILMSVMWMTVPSWSFTTSAPTSDSAAEAMKLSRMTEDVWSGTLGVGVMEGGFETSGGR